ncbi:peroxiredoxin [Cystoisospora suis]|uniref:Peroxiredoxin n=1 Tax=Cystoisospora suis TaxID=483139 RepID=A0A2C6LBF7_9APIC|nr:peroxiredoxin [Cystoisospora suis]
MSAFDEHTRSPRSGVSQHPFPVAFLCGILALSSLPLSSVSFVVGAGGTVNAPVTASPEKTPSGVCSAPLSSAVSSSSLSAASVLGSGSLAFPKTRTLREGDPAPHCVWKARVRGADGSMTWGELDSASLFGQKRVVVFSLPGAFTPTCSSRHLPDFDKLYDTIKALGVDEVYCISVNDTFVMNAWAEHLQIKNVKMIPDGNGCFTAKMGMMVDKSNLGFGPRSWRYAAVIENGVLEKLMVEGNMRDNADDDPFAASDAESVLRYLREHKN